MFYVCWNSFSKYCFFIDFDMGVGMILMCCWWISYSHTDLAKPSFLTTVWWIYMFLIFRNQWFVKTFQIFVDTCSGIDIEWVWASISSPSWYWLGIKFHVLRDCLLHDFWDLNFIDYLSTMVPKSIGLGQYVHSRFQSLLHFGTRLSPFRFPLTPFWHPSAHFLLPSESL